MIGAGCLASLRVSLGSDQGRSGRTAAKAIPVGPGQNRANALQRPGERRPAAIPARARGPWRSSLQNVGNGPVQHFRECIGHGGYRSVRHRFCASGVNRAWRNPRTLELYMRIAGESGSIRWAWNFAGMHSALPTEWKQDRSAGRACLEDQPTSRMVSSLTWHHAPADTVWCRLSRAPRQLPRGCFVDALERGDRCVPEAAQRSIALPRRHESHAHRRR